MSLTLHLTLNRVPRVQANIYSVITCRMFLNIRYVARQGAGYPTLHDYHEPQINVLETLEFGRNCESNDTGGSVGLSTMQFGREDSDNHNNGAV
jgi:hypothetical protein